MSRPPPSSPYARALAARRGIDLAALRGSGPGGRIIARDLDAAPPTAAATAPAPPDPRLFYDPARFTEAPPTTMRRAIARRMAASFREIPHFALTIDCGMDALLDLRARINAATERRFSLNDFLLRAAALALMEVPDVNVSFARDAVLRHAHADISFALALPGGLVTPIIRDAEQKPVPRISQEVRALTARARAARLAPEDYEGGTFTLSNLGMFGLRAFTAIINPPQAAVLTAAAALEDGGKKVMQASLCCDHRAIDGAAGARFLQAFRDLVEAPILLAA